MLRNTCLLILLFVLMSALSYALQVRDRDATWVAPSEDALNVNPLASRPDTVAGGRKLFHQRCSNCHGESARGTTKAPDLTQDDVQAQTDGALFWKISGGNSRQGMPGFSFLPESQRWQLVLHIRAAVGTKSNILRDRRDTGVVLAPRNGRLSHGDDGGAPW
jgi:mono/diheme cytochrome c family protein